MAFSVPLQREPVEVSDVLVAGGGLAGAACAISLAKVGRQVVLVEREARPAHKICGEFLSSEAQASLLALGLDVRALGGHLVTHVRLVRGGRCVTARLPFEGLGLTRRALDEALLVRAAAVGTDVRRGQSIRRIGFDDGVFAEIDQGEILRPRALMLATGKHEARGSARASRPGRMVGFKTYFRLATEQQRALSGHVELILFPGGYAGLQLVEGQAANFSLLVEGRLLRRLGGKWASLLEYMQHSSPHLAARLAGSEDVLTAPLTIARVPYGFRHRPSAGDPPALFRLGDQAAVIQSFTGDGMAIALHSAALAAHCCAAGESAAAYHTRLRADVSGQIRRAALLHATLSAPLLGPAVFAAAAVFPAALAAAAALTRVPEHARLTG